MFQRSIKPSKSQSFFIFGARGTGKSTWLKHDLSGTQFKIDLLQDEAEQRYIHQPDLLESDIQALKKKVDWVVIDEIQKVPKLLDVVHRMIENSKQKFVMTGSSARKLKRNAANLLAGRALVKNLYPLTSSELGDRFYLDEVLQWGSLPKIYSLPVDERASFLRAYTQTYLREEILLEQLVRNGQSFRDFLGVAANENGNTLNFTRIARDLGVDVKTVQNFFSIMEDTLVGFYLPAFHRSVRKSQKLQPKFYIFDLGVKHGMEGSLRNEILPRTSAYGKAFEHFFILEVKRLNDYHELDYRLSHYQDTKGGEIDLILSRARKTIAIEIKSSDRANLVDIRKLKRLGEALKADKLMYISQDKTRSLIEGVECIHWIDALTEICK